MCSCIQEYNAGELRYQVVSGDGLGALGSAGNCGYVYKDTNSATNPSITSCTLDGNDLCNGNGFCDENAPSCTCYKGWSGISCSIRECPSGPAWIDEPISATNAHAPAECSNMGFCDHSTGTTTPGLVTIVLDTVTTSSDRLIDQDCVSVRADSLDLLVRSKTAYALTIQASPAMAAAGVSA
jgi:hypothetical protein